MRGMNSACVDLIYLDPPFNSKRDYAAPIGSKAAGAEFKDTWTLDDIDKEWIDLIAEKKENRKLHQVLLSAMTDSDKSYLVYMSVRLLEMHRILKPDGSIYLHCDQTMSHYLKLVMDAIFGRANFQNNFIWYYSGGGASTTRWAKKHDDILFYAKSKKWTFNADNVRVPYKWTNGQKRADGSKRDYSKGKLADDVWEHHALMPWAKESTGFKTQKPLELLDRIIQASSDEGDLVFDPFCGCATTLASADRLGREWVGIDISPEATRLIKMRIEDQQGLWRNIITRTDIPQRTDLGKLPPPRSHFKKLYGEQLGKCNGCKRKPDDDFLDVDHIIAKSKGGTDHIENLQLLCRTCNRIKRDGSMEELKKKLKKLGMFEK